MLADEHNLDRGKSEIGLDLVAICAQRRVQIEELKRLTNVIISPPSLTTNNPEFLLAHYSNLGASFLFLWSFVGLMMGLLLPRVLAPSSFQPADYSQSSSLEGEGHDWNFSSKLTFFF